MKPLNRYRRPKGEDRRSAAADMISKGNSWMMGNEAVFDRPRYVSHERERFKGEAARAKQYKRYCELTAMKPLNRYRRPKGEDRRSAAADIISKGNSWMMGNEAGLHEKLDNMYI